MKVAYFWPGYLLCVLLLNTIFVYKINLPLSLAKEVGEFTYTDSGFIYSGRGKKAVDVYSNGSEILALPQGVSIKDDLSSSHLFTVSKKRIYNGAGDEGYLGDYISKFSVVRVGGFAAVLNFFCFILYCVGFSLLARIP